MQNANALCAAASQFVDEQLPCLTAPLWRPVHPLGTKNISHTQTSSFTVFRVAHEHQVHRDLSPYTSLLRDQKHFWTFIYPFAFTHTHLHTETFTVHRPLLDCDAAGYSESQRRKWEVVVQGGESERGRQRSRGERKSGSETVGGEERRRDGKMVRRQGRKESKKGEGETGRERGMLKSEANTVCSSWESAASEETLIHKSSSLFHTHMHPLLLSSLLGYWYSGRDRPGTVCPCRWGDAASALSVGVYVCGCLSLTVSACGFMLMPAEFL